MPFNTLLALFRLTRFWNLVIIAVAQYLTAIFLVPLHAAAFYDWRLFVLSLATVLIAAAGYIINDYYDVKIDLINKPDRVVIGKAITRRYAILFHVFISCLGILLSFLLNWKIGCLNTFCVFLLWLYSNSLKRQPFIGNFVVALLTGFSIVLVNFLFESAHSLILIYSLFAFFMTLVREIVKDMEDMKGDTNFGCRTLPIIWGIRKTKWLLYLLTASFSIAVLAINFYYHLMPWYYFTTFLVFPMLILVGRLLKADTKKEFNRLSQLCKLIMLLGIVSMIFI